MRWPRAALILATLVLAACGATGEAAPTAETVAPETPTTVTTVPALVGGSGDPRSTPPPTATTPPDDVSTTGPTTTAPGPGPTTSAPDQTTTTIPGTRPEEPAGSTTTAPPTTSAPEPVEEWTEHPLAAAVPDGALLGADWTRTSVVVAEATAGGADDDICGIESPPSPAGLEAGYDAGDLRSAQIIIGAGPESAATIEAFRLAVECEFGGELGPGARITELDTSILDADDAVAAQVELGDDTAELSMTFVVARWSDQLVAVSVGSFSDGAPVEGDEVLRIAALVGDGLGELALS